MEKLNRFAPIVLILMGLFILLLRANALKNVIALVFIVMGVAVLFLRRK
jgi:multisubunit Na+/H+ antiporter MnhC subunit